jgi:outer membrane protein TolC
MGTALLLTALPVHASAQAPQTPTAPAGPVRALSLDEAVRLALEQNLSLQVQRIAPQVADETIRQARTAWTPTVTGGASLNSADSAPDSFLSGSADTVKSDLFQSSFGVQQLLPWGSSYSVSWDASRSTSNSIFTNFNPRLRSGLSMAFRQPLLRDRTIDSARQQLLISKRNREISDVELRGAVVGTIRSVKSAYYDLAFAYANLQVQKQSLELARQTLKDNRTRVEVGTMAPIDIVEAESEVARNEENVIVAEASIKTAEDRLRSLVFDPGQAEFWTMTLEPTDKVEVVVPSSAIDVDAAVRNALEKRTDLIQARKQIENTEVSIRYLRNQVLPQVNFEADLSTSGLGGTQFLRGPGFPGEIIGEVSRSLWSVQGDVFGFDYPNWTLGVSVSYPLGTSAAQANLARTRLQLNQSQLQIRNVELQVGTQVRDAARQVNTNLKRIDATRAAQALAERRLEAEQKKFGVGMSTSFQVFQAQRDLATARNNYLRAAIDYHKSQADFEAVQEASIGGSSGISIATGSAATTSATTGAVR